MAVTKMTRYFFNFCILLILSRCVDSCVLPRSIQASVPQTITAGYIISKVDVDHCDTKALHFTTNDLDFKVDSDGTIVTVHTTTVPTNGRLFSVWSQDPNGEKSEMDVYLIQNTKKVSKDGLLRRSKRRWAPMPFKITENELPPFPKDVDVIGSDSSADYNVYYTISGPGVTEGLVGTFSVDRNTGMLKVHRSVDRETYPQFIFQARVFDRTTNMETDLPLPITVNVADVNDNDPTFTDSLQFYVPEQSEAGVVVGKVNATDRDQEDTDHTKIRYTLLTGREVFAINPVTGIITTKTTTFDREVKDTYFAIVEIRDMDGQTNGLFNTATATIKLSDVNDNPPTFSKTSYNVNVKENQADGLILRIPIKDKDLENSPNWKSQFVIAKGNENGNFRIETDPKTNEGLLYIAKPLDYEKTKDLKLEIMARNKAELSGTTASWVSVPVDVSVTNVDEGPEFSAPTVRFPVQENTPNGTLIGTYTALDPETKSSSGIKYYKVTDPASWVSVDVNTGELKVANTIDMESSFVKDGIYNVTMKAVDASSKTGTGTVIIQVEDVNDHIPNIPSKDLVVCEKDVGMGSVLVTAVDKDKSPFSAPFSFTLEDDKDGNWAVTKFNDTTAKLEQTKELPTGLYNVPLMVKDLQGSGKTQTVAVRICRCRNNACLPKDSSISLGVGGILAMLLGLAMLLMLLLLCGFACVTKGDKLEIEDMGDSGGVLLKSNIEAPGDEVDTNLIIIPACGTDQSVKGSLIDVGWAGTKNSSMMGGGNMHQNLLQQSSGVMLTDMQNGFSAGQCVSPQYDAGQFGTSQFGTSQIGTSQFGTGQYGTAQYDAGQFGTVQYGTGTRFTDSAAYQNWQTNGLYLKQKLAYLGMEEKGRYADDILHSYGFEGVGSPVGSVGCCSDHSNQDNLDFLNTLGPKFKNLAEVCKKE